MNGRTLLREDFMSIIHSRHQWARLRDRFRDHCRRTNALCHLCVQRGDVEHAVIDYATARSPWSFEADHLKSVDAYPHLAFEWSNLRASHARCNRQKGPKAVVIEHEWVEPDW